MEVIRAAYRSLMQRHHPDKNPNVPDSTARVAAMTQAYDVLSVPDSRRAYDEALAADFNVRAFEPHDISNNHAYGYQSQNQRQRKRQPDSNIYWRIWMVLLLFLFISIGSMVVYFIFNWTKYPLVFASLKNTPLFPEKQSPVATNAETVVDSGLLGSQSQGSSAIKGMALRGDNTFTLASELAINFSSLEVGGTTSLRILRLPRVDIRLNGEESNRLFRVIDARQSVIYQRLFMALGKVEYDSLLKADGEKYLMGIISDAICWGAELNNCARHTNAGEPNGSSNLYFEVILSESFSIN